jgi:hypothetical protein
MIILMVDWRELHITCHSLYTRTWAISQITLNTDWLALSCENGRIDLWKGDWCWIVTCRCQLLNRRLVSFSGQLKIFWNILYIFPNYSLKKGPSYGHGRMVVGFTTTCAISSYHHWSCEFESCSWHDNIVL